MATLTNNAKTYDIADELKAFANAKSKSTGAYLRCAVALYQTMTAKELKTRLVSVAKIGSETQNSRLVKFAQDNCPAYVEAEAKSAKYGAMLKRKGTSEDRKNELRHDKKPHDAIKSSILSMLRNASVSAYWLSEKGAVSVTLSHGDRFAKITYAAPITRETDIDGKPEFIRSETLTNAELNRFGKALAVEHGLHTAPTAEDEPRIDTKAGATAATVAGELAATIGKLSADASSEFTSSETSEALLVALVRKLYAADGTIVVPHMIDALRKHAGMAGVQLVTETPTRKPRAPKPEAETQAA